MLLIDGSVQQYVLKRIAFKELCCLIELLLLKDFNWILLIWKIIRIMCLHIVLPIQCLIKAVSLKLPYQNLHWLLFLHWIFSLLGRKQVLIVRLKGIIYFFRLQRANAQSLERRLPLRTDRFLMPVFSIDYINGVLHVIVSPFDSC